MAKNKSKGRRKDHYRTTSALQPFNDIIDRVCDQDKKYFKEHPDIGVYARNDVPGEFWPFVFPGDIIVVVRQLFPGFLMRSPCRIEKTGVIGNEAWKQLIKTCPEILEITDNGGD
jgi:hypothetical protein